MNIIVAGLAGGRRLWHPGLPACRASAPVPAFAAFKGSTERRQWHLDGAAISDAGSDCELYQSGAIAQSNTCRPRNSGR